MKTYLIATCLCLIALVFLFRLWRANLHIPFYYNWGYDVDWSMYFVKSVMDTGWIFRNPWLGAPGVQEYYDILQGDSLQTLLIKAIGTFAPDFGTTLNLYYLLTFVLTTWTSLFALRAFGISRQVSIVASLLYAFQPFHFVRGQLHHAYSCYLAVPLIAMVLLWLCEGDPIFVYRVGRKIRWLPSRPRALPAVAACLLVACSGAYFALFAAILVALAALVTTMRRGKFAQSLDSLIALALICGVFALNLAPKVWYERLHGKNPAAVIRQPSESIYGGIRLTTLITTVPYNTLKDVELALLGRGGRVMPSIKDYERMFGVEFSSSSLGIVGSIGFLALLAALFLLRRPRGDLRLLGALSRLNIGACLVAMPWSFCYVFALLVSPQVRAWVRMSIFVAFFSVMAIALLLDHLHRARFAGPRASWLFRGALGGLLVFGLLDQMSQAFVPDHAAQAASFSSDREFFRRIEAALPERAMVFQLPHVPFPEEYSRHNRASWTFLSAVHLKAYLHTKRVRWSSGAIKGREVARWQQHIAEEPAGKMLADLTRAGFRGLYIDRDGYDDGDDTRLIAEFGRLLRIEPIRNERGNLAFFTLPGGVQSAPRSALSTRNPADPGRPVGHSPARTP